MNLFALPFGMNKRSLHPASTSSAMNLQCCHSAGEAAVHLFSFCFVFRLYCHSDSARLHKVVGFCQGDDRGRVLWKLVC